MFQILYWISAVTSWGAWIYNVIYHKAKRHDSINGSDRNAKVTSDVEDTLPGHSTTGS